jgi:hypothetical protein
MLSSVQIIRLASLLLLIFSQGVSIKAQERGYLDATQAKIRQRQRDPVTGTSGGVFSGYTEGKQQPTQALALTLKIRDGVELAPGVEFEYEVQIRNASDYPIEIPWDLSSADIEPADPRAKYQYQTVAIWLDARLGNNRAVSMEAPIVLFGTPSVATTMIKLQPGEWARIKAKGHVLPSNPNNAWPPPDLTSRKVEGSLAATLLVYDHSFSPTAEGNSHEDSRMTNAPIYSKAVLVHFRF